MPDHHAAEDIDERVTRAQHRADAGGHIGDLARAKLARADETGHSEMLSAAECRWLAERDRDAANAEHHRLLAERYKRYAARVTAEAGPGVSVVARIRDYAYQQNPAKQRWLLEELLPLVEAWVDGVSAAAELEPTA